MTDESEPVVVPADRVGEPTALRPLAERIFGRGDRRPGWFARKLRRECVDPGLSRLLVRPDHDPADPAAWLGYVLVGTPPSLNPIARTAGCGIIGSARGHGRGRRLLAAAAQAAAARGLTALQVPAASHLEGYYRDAAGMDPLRREVTLLAFGGSTTADDPWPPPGDPEPWTPADVADTHDPVSQWLAEAWERTEPDRRRTLRFEGCVVHLGAEGRAWLVHRTLAPRAAPDRILAALDAVARRAPVDVPVLVAGLPAVSSVTQSLEDAAWVPVQRATIMQRSTERGPETPSTR